MCAAQLLPDVAARMYSALESIADGRISHTYPTAMNYCTYIYIMCIHIYIYIHAHYILIYIDILMYTHIYIYTCIEY